MLVHFYFQLPPKDQPYLVEPQTLRPCLLQTLWLRSWSKSDYPLHTEAFRKEPRKMNRLRSTSQSRVAATIHLLVTVTASISLGVSSKSQAKVIDGFFMFCTSNLDGTGVCVNQEDGREFSCLIVPGQIISCPAANSRSVECVWISGISANSAQFWCDPDKETAMYSDSSFENLPDVIRESAPSEQNIGPSPINQNEFNSEIFR